MTRFYEEEPSIRRKSGLHGKQQQDAAACYPRFAISSEMLQSACEGYRFGRFEVWIRNGWLLRDGKRIRIEELPFQLLVVLLESPGEVVSKETLRQRLWGDRVFGELDNSLHVAAAKLREALRETAGAAQH